MLRPSKASRWVKCPGSIFTESEDDPNEAALFGTKTHELAAKILDDGLRTLMKGRPEQYVCEDYSLDMATIAYEYAKRMLAVCRTLRVFGGPNLGIEEKIRISKFCEGTADFYAYSAPAKCLVVADLKTGYGFIDEIDCEQLMLYARGIIQKLKIPHDVEVCLKIYQPRWFKKPFRTWKTSVVNILSTTNKMLDAGEQAILNADTTVKSGRHCKYCAAYLRCDASRKTDFSIFDMESMDLDADITDSHLALELVLFKDALDRIKNRVSVLEETAVHRMKNGSLLPTWNLCHNKGKTVWLSGLSNGEIVKLCQAYGIDAMSTAITPKQAVAKGMPDSVVRAFSEVKQGKMKIERVSQNDIHRAFMEKDE